MLRIGAYVGRGPVTSAVVSVVVQTDVARDALCADNTISQNSIPGVTRMREVHQS